MGGNQNNNGVDNVAFREQALRTSKLSYRRHFKSAQYGILTPDTEAGRSNNANSSRVKPLNFSRDEIAGHTMPDKRAMVSVTGPREKITRVNNQFRAISQCPRPELSL
jgi:hypothetical protein